MSGTDWIYNCNTFGIKPNENTLAVLQDSGIIPASQQNYLVYNIGRTEVNIDVKYGTEVNWFGDIVKDIQIKPGEKKIIDIGRNIYYVTGLQVYNKTKTRAVVHCATADDKFEEQIRKPGDYIFDDARNKLLKEIFILGLKFVPFVGGTLYGLLDTFWPANKPNVWDQIQDKVQALIDKKALEIIEGILNGDIKQYQEKIKALVHEMEDGGDLKNIRNHYMSIAQELIGFEKKFIFGAEMSNYQSVNQSVLPYYSNVVMMKVSFYLTGIQRAREIGLSDEDVRYITNYANITVYGDKDNGANRYITDMYKERVDDAYNTYYAQNLYNAMMNTRSYIANQGLEYIPIWNHMLENPRSNDAIYNDVISYSTYYGRPTANQIKEAIPDEPSQPLTPNLIDGKRNKLVSIDVYIWRKNDRGPSKIGGIKVYFENGDDYMMGTSSDVIQTIKFKGALLIKLVVFGSGALDYLEFHFSDDRVEQVGEKAANISTTFELDNHHIVSLLLNADMVSCGGQAVNISVAYQLIEKSVLDFY